MNRRILAIALFVCGSLLPLSAQQLTRFAVIDLQKVYSVFFRDSKAVRDLEDRSAKVNADIQKMTEELQALNSQKLEANAAGDQAKVLKLESDIYKKNEYLKEYYRVKSAEIADQKAKLSQSSTFMKQVLDEIRIVAESEGYSVVLNLKDNAGILWYSPAVDITDLVVQNLMTKAGQH